MPIPKPSLNPSDLPQPAVLQLELVCALDRVRPAAEAARQFLKQQGCPPQEVLDCELALVEACNNAIQYATPARRHLPVRVELYYQPHEIELRITDHSAGFAWPQTAVLPDPESEHGRGVYLIQAVMDQADYRHHPEGNTLILRKRRSTH